MYRKLFCNTEWVEFELEMFEGTIFKKNSSKCTGKGFCIIGYGLW
jgi:hypothetical protein